MKNMEQTETEIKAITKNVYDGNHTTGYDVIDIILEAKRMGGHFCVESWELDVWREFKKPKEGYDQYGDFIGDIGYNDEKQFPQTEDDSCEPFFEGELRCWELVLCLMMRAQRKLVWIEDMDKRLDMKSVEDIVRAVLYDTTFSN